MTRLRASHGRPAGPHRPAADGSGGLLDDLRSGTFALAQDAPPHQKGRVAALAAAAAPGHSLPTEDSAPRWEKVLWKPQPFPDNYVDHTFLQHLVRGAGTADWLSGWRLRAGGVPPPPLSVRRMPL